MKNYIDDIINITLSAITWGLLYKFVVKEQNLNKKKKAFKWLLIAPVLLITLPFVLPFIIKLLYKND